jgi:hypothetical protein
MKPQFRTAARVSFLHCGGQPPSTANAHAAAAKAPESGHARRLFVTSNATLVPRDSRRLSIHAVCGVAVRAIASTV